MLEVIFPTGRAQLPQWHGPGVVVEMQSHETAAGGVEEWVRVLFESDGWDDWFSDPARDVEVAFHKPEGCKRKRCSCKQQGPRVGTEKLHALRAMVRED